MKKLLPISPRMLIVGFSMLLFSSVQGRAQSVSDVELIKQTALDYIEGWYEENSERMERALHPELAKRIVRTNQDGKSRLDQMSAMSLVQGTRRGGGKDRTAGKKRKAGSGLGVCEKSASSERDEVRAVG